jgi:hypothetical protein
VLVSLALVCVVPAFAAAQSSEPERLDQFLRGNHLLVSYREGGAVYGTYYVLQIHYCSSGKYFLYGESSKQTVLGNYQQGNWQEAGTWAATAVQGQLGVRYQPQGQVPNFVPVRMLPNDGIWVGEGVSVIPQGPAQC